MTIRTNITTIITHRAALSSSIYLELQVKYTRVIFYDAVVECSTPTTKSAFWKMYVHTKHVMVTPRTSMQTWTLLPAFAGSCPQNINT